MKKTLLTLAVLFSMTQTSHALIFNGQKANCRGENDATCALAITFSLPTILVGAQAELSLADKAELIHSEAQKMRDGLTSESVLLQNMAEATGKDLNVLVDEILAK